MPFQRQTLRKEGDQRRDFLNLVTRGLELKNIAKTVVTERKIVDDEDVDEFMTLYSPNKRQNRF